MFLFVNDSLGQFNMNLKLLQQKVITYYLKLVRCCEILQLMRLTIFLYIITSPQISIKQI